MLRYEFKDKNKQFSVAGGVTYLYMRGFNFLINEWGFMHMMSISVNE